MNKLIKIDLKQLVDQLVVSILFFSAMLNRLQSNHNIRTNLRFISLLRKELGIAKQI